MKKIGLNIALVLSFIFFLGCKTDNVNGILLENNLVVHQDYSKNKRMVSLIKSSLNKDSSAFKSLIEFSHGGGESGYNLGYVITQIINKIGEDEIIKMVSKYDSNELNNFRSYIDVGLEYGDNDYDGEMDETYIKDEFPKLNKYLMNKQNK
ncbi:hypothetical protein [Winogradskyella sp. R77965]|uniref:hypothetical protein n=1 Tax=Winogradskyella sp. R77965 TaxID=3093872 RepID=UPI0037DC76CD